MKDLITDDEGSVIGFITELDILEVVLAGKESDRDSRFRVAAQRKIVTGFRSDRRDSGNQ